MTRCYEIAEVLVKHNTKDKMVKTTHEEIWKQYKESNYWVSNTGFVKSTYGVTDRLMATCDDGHGYLKTTLSFGISQAAFKIHILVAELFVEKPDGDVEVNHIDCNKHNNSAYNLEWITHASNMKHGWANECFDRGEDSYIAVLTEENVSEIKIAFVEYKLSNTELALKYNVAKGTISKIRSKQTWNHVRPELVYPPSSPDESNKKKLCGADIPQIRKFYKSGLSLAEIGRKFNVHSGTINGIVSGKTWKNY